MVSGMNVKSVLVVCLLTTALVGGCASSGSPGSGMAGRCATLKQISENEKGNPSRQEQARRDYYEHCGGATR